MLGYHYPYHHELGRENALTLRWVSGPVSCKLFIAYVGGAHKAGKELLSNVNRRKANEIGCIKYLVRKSRK